MKKSENLDLITIGRSSVDLYGSQIGGRLEDMRTFQKYIGGSPTNIAAGAARLGLKSAIITRVGNEHMGRFIVEQLKKEGEQGRQKINQYTRYGTVILAFFQAWGIAAGIESQGLASEPGLFFRVSCVVTLVGGTMLLMWLGEQITHCLLYTSPSPRDRQKSRMPSSA